MLARRSGSCISAKQTGITPLLSMERRRDRDAWSMIHRLHYGVADDDRRRCAWQSALIERGNVEDVDGAQRSDRVGYWRSHRVKVDGHT
jgi:hypothetical protein